MTKLIAAVLGAALVVGIAFEIVKSTVSYQLWRYRRDPDSVQVFTPPLCSRGPSVLPAIYDAFEAHGGDPDVGKFRLAIVHELRCIRRKQGDVVSTDNERRDLPEDRRMFDTIVRAWNEEPSAVIRQEMLAFMDELDFRAWYAIWAGIQSGPHPLEGVYRIPIPSTADRGDAARAQWCRVIRPVALRRIASDADSDDTSAEIEVGRAHCNDADATVLMNVVRMPRSPMAAYGALRGLIEMADTAERAQRMLVPLLDCANPHELFRDLRGMLTASAAGAVGQAIAQCSGMCGTAAECQTALTYAASGSGAP